MSDISLLTYALVFLGGVLAETIGLRATASCMNASSRCPKCSSVVVIDAWPS